MNKEVIIAIILTILVYSILIIQNGNAENSLCDNSLTTFYDGESSNLVEFPTGGEDYSTKIKLPIGVLINNAEVRLSGLPVELSAEKQVDVVLVNDVSGSMIEENKLNILKNAAKEFIDIVLNDENKIGLVSYGFSLDSYTGLTNDKNALKNEIDSYIAEGGTCVSCGINKAIELLSESEKQEKIILLMSDGYANVCIGDSPYPDNCKEAAAGQEALDKAQEAANAGIKIYTVAFESGYNNVELMENIAETGNGKSYEASTVNLEEVYEEIAEYLLSSYPVNAFLDIGNNGVEEWSYPGSFETSELVAGFESELQNLLSSCSCPGCSLTSGNCIIDFKFSSDTAGKILVDNLLIEYQEQCYIECFDNSDCPSYNEGNYCGIDGNVWQRFQNGNCVNPGEVESYCQYSGSDLVVENCSALNLPQIATCNNVPDSNPFTWDFASALNGVCVDDGNAFCAVGDYNFSHNLIIGKCGVECLSDGDCNQGEYCSEIYQCVEQGEPECEVNADCGNISYSEDYCKNDNVVKDIFTPTCLNETCSIEKSIELVEECEFGCHDGECKEEEEEDDDEEFIFVEDEFFENQIKLIEPINYGIADEIVLGKEQEKPGLSWIWILLIAVAVLLFLILISLALRR